MNPNRVVLTGYYGCGNLGDEALRETVVAALVDAGITPFVIGGRDRFRPGKIISAVRGAAGIVFGGGGLLQNATSSRSLYYYLGLIKFTHALRRPVFLVGQGLGPITGAFARAITRHVLSQVDYLGVRDRTSHDLAAQLGIAAALDGDLYFLNPPLPAAIPRSDPAQIGVALSGRSIVRRLADWRRFLTALAARYKIVLIPFFPREDRAALARIAAGVPTARVEIPRSVKAAQEMIAKLGLLISSRLHPLEFALRAGVPMIAVSADPKIAAFGAEIKALGGPDVPCVELPRPDGVIALLDNPPPNSLFAAAYAALHHRTKAGFERFLAALLQKIGGDDD